MQYYCNICRVTITEGQYRYSKDRFGRALCGKHQEIEKANQNEKTSPPIVEEKVEPLVVKEESISSDETKTGWKGLIKKAAVVTGQSIIKGTKVVAEKTKKSIDERSWKDQILRRMDPNQIKQLAHEKRIHPMFVEKPTIDNYIDAIKNRVSLDDIIIFARRNHMNIRDILTKIEYAKTKEDIKEMTRKGKDIDDFFLQVVDTINNFKPFETYSEEKPYQIDLARSLKNRFPETKIEETRGSTRPDIVIRGIAIEVKGPTFYSDLEKISDKCVRYTQSYPKGMIVVLFDVKVSHYRLEDWIKDIKNKFPDVIVIKK
jgi:hypothetical protein